MQHKTYTNGLNLITVPIKGTKTATIIVMTGTGSRYENKDNNGLSHFVEHMLFKGTKKRPSSKIIVSEIDSLGCEYNAFTSKEYTGYWIKVDSSKLDKMSEVLSDMYINSKFVASEIDRERGVIIEEINMREDNPLYTIEDLFEELLYGDTPFGWDISGPKKNILNVQRIDFLNYVNSQYGPNNTTVVITGNVSSKQGEAIIKKHFDNASFNKRGKKYKIKERAEEIQTKPDVKLKYKNTDQAHLCLGVRAFGDGHKNEIAMKTMALVLGGSMSSRLFMNLRERNGLAYYVRTSDEVYTDAGYLVTQAGVPVDKVERAIEIIISEYKKLKTTLITASELKRTKDMVKGRYAIDLESSENVATWYAKQATTLNTINLENSPLEGTSPNVPLGTGGVLTKRGGVLSSNLKLITPDQYLKKLAAVDAKTIRQVAKEIFVNAKLNLSIIGPYKDEKKFEKLLKF